MRERHESVVERKIREAQERGAFDDLPGKGRPLRGLHSADDENWWIRGFVERHGIATDALLPTPLRLRKEVERLPETVRDLPTEDAVRDVVAALNARIAAWRRVPDGPRVTVRSASADEVVEAWRASRGARGGRVGGTSATPGARAGTGADTDTGADPAEPADPRRRRLRRWRYARGR